MGNCSNCWTSRKPFDDFVSQSAQPVPNLQKRPSEIYSDIDIGSNTSMSVFTDHSSLFPEFREENEDLKVQSFNMTDHMKFTLQEINLAKTYERIIKEPFVFLIKIFHNGMEYQSEQYTAVENHTYINRDFTFDLLNTPTVVILQLMAIRKEITTEIGYATFDTDSVSPYQKFRGHIPLFYRGMKIALVLCELAKFSSDFPYDYMTLGSPIKEATRVTYLPSKDYPIPLSNLNSSTPKFLSKSSFASDNKTCNFAYIDVVAAIDKIKDVKTGINELVELLDKDYPEIIYHTCERLKYFVCQQSYAHTIAANKFSRLCEILNNYYKDPMVSLQLLWVLYRLSEQSVFLNTEWNRDDNELLRGVVKVLKEVRDVETCSLALELLIKQIPDSGSKIKLVYLCENEDLCRQLIILISRFSSTQVLAPVLQLLSNVMDIQYKPHLREAIYNTDFLPLLENALYQHVLNNEVFLYAMKIALLFTGDLLYRDGIAISLSFNKLKPALSLYNKDLNKQKLCLMLIRNLLTSETKQKNLDEFEEGLIILTERLECFSDNSIIFGNIALILKDSLERVSYIPTSIKEPRFIHLLISGVSRHYQDMRVTIHILMLMKRMKELEPQVNSMIRANPDLKRGLREINAYYSTDFRARTDEEKRLVKELMNLSSEMI